MLRVLVDVLLIPQHDTNENCEGQETLHFQIKRPLHLPVRAFIPLLAWQYVHS